MLRYSIFKFCAIIPFFLLNNALNVGILFSLIYFEQTFSSITENICLCDINNSYELELYLFLILISYDKHEKIKL